jgi:pimeloyl-ACP methyl ester carboxylesterase
LLKTIQYESSQIVFREEGKGQPVVLLHGFAEDHSIWDQLVLDLKDECRLLLPDLPGSGLSDPISDMSMEGIAHCVNQILDTECPRNSSLSGDGIILIGHSMGGYISLALAERYPSKLAGLGLLHSTAYADSLEKKNARIKSMEFIRQHGPALFIRQSTPNLFSDRFKQDYPEILETMILRYADFKEASLLSYYEAMMKRPDRTGVLSNFPGRILFIIGEEDLAIPLEDSLRQCHLPRISHIHILEDTAHMGMLESKEKTKTALHLFIELAGQQTQ